MKRMLALATLVIAIIAASTGVVPAQTAPLIVVGIVESNGVSFAAVSERVHGKVINYFAAVGAHFGDATVVRINREGITLSNGRRLQIDPVAAARERSRQRADLRRAGIIEPVAAIASGDV